jgi:hypothetical protein
MGDGDPGEMTKISSERIVAFLLPHSSREDIQEGWERALYWVLTQSTFTLESVDLSKMWLTVLELFLAYGADPSTVTKQNLRSTSAKERDWSVEEVVTLLAGNHIDQGTRVLSLIPKKEKWWHRLGISKPPVHTKESTLKLDWQLFPERTWWKSETL